MTICGIRVLTVYAAREQNDAELKGIFGEKVVSHCEVSEHYCELCKNF